jgi:hypothetical protein
MRGVAVCRRLSPSAGASVLTIPRFLSASRRLGSADARCTTPATHDNLSFEAQSRGSHTRCLRFAAFLPALSRSYGHARLASGWWPAFTGRGSRPRKVPNEVSASSTWLPPHPSFRNASNVRVMQHSFSATLQDTYTDACRVRNPQSSTPRAFRRQHRAIPPRRLNRLRKAGGHR